MSAAVTPASPAEVIRPLRLSVNASASLLGNIVYTACQAGLLIALARFGNPAMVGQFALGLAVCGPIMLVASLQLRAVQVTDAAHRHDFSEYVALRLITSLAALAAIVIAALFFADGNITTGAAVVLIGLLRNVQAVSDVYRGLMQKHERMERVAMSAILRGFAELPVFALALWAGGGLIGAVVALIAVDLLVWRSWDVHNARVLLRSSAPRSRWNTLMGVAPHFDVKLLATIARTALPLGLVSMLLSLNTYLPQYAIKHGHGESQLGIFAALLYTITATNLLVGAVGQSASPRLAKLYEAGKQAAFNTLHKRMLLFAAGVGLLTIAGAALLGEPLLRIIYGPAYAAQSRLFVQLAAVSAVIQLVSLQGYTVTATRSFRAQLPVSVLVATTTGLVALLAVPHFGMQGAAAAMLSGTIVQGAGYSILLRRAKRRMPHPLMREQPHAFA